MRKAPDPARCGAIAIRPALVTLFGSYRGTGLRWANPVYFKEKILLRDALRTRSGQVRAARLRAQTGKR